MNDTKYNYVSFKQCIKHTTLGILRDATQNF